MAQVAVAVATLAADPDIAAAVATARAACRELREHPVMRRLRAEAAAEASVRAARASAALEGGRLPVALVRDAARGAVPYPDDAAGATVRGAVRALAAAGQLAGTWPRAPWQALASLHVAAAARLVPDEALGRPRRPGEAPGDGRDLLDAAGREVEAPDGPALQARLDALVDLLAGAASAGPGSALVVAGLAHAEVAVVRPFVAGNGVVARALARAVLHDRGVDPTGVALWEAALLAYGPRYPLTLAAYATEGLAGVRAWLLLFAESLTDGAAEGRVACDAVRAGRFDG